MYETLERRATTLVLAAGIVIPLSATFASVGLAGTDVPALLVMVSLGLLTTALCSRSLRSCRRSGPTA